MSFENDWNSEPEAEGGSFSLVDEGTYEAVLCDMKLDMSKDPIRLTFVYQIASGSFEKRKVFGNYQLKGKGIGFIKKDMKALGIDYSKITKPEDIADLIWDALPVDVEIYVKHNEYNGKTYANVYLNGKADITREDGFSNFDDAQRVPF